ncbi:hypothetical protein ACVGWL_00910, partial [Enterobacter asburiae]
PPPPPPPPIFKTRRPNTKYDGICVGVVFFYKINKKRFLLFVCNFPQVYPGGFRHITHLNKNKGWFLFACGATVHH